MTHWAVDHLHTARTTSKIGITFVAESLLMNREYGAVPTSQEELLLAATEGAHEYVAVSVAQGFAEGRSPGFLSVLRPDLLFDFAQTWRNFASAEKGVNSSAEDKSIYKSALFEASVADVAEGDPAAISMLPKLSTSLGQLTLALETALEHRDSVHEWRASRRYLQYLGTFDPQHIGHRTTVRSVLEVAGDQFGALVHVMGEHPSKTNIHASYEARYDESEERLYRSSLIDNTRVTQLDVPGGTGLANHGLGQMELLADMSGDDCMRWVIGGDKFMLDSANIRQKRSAAKAVLRFSDPRLRVYVVSHHPEELGQLKSDVDYIVDRFGTPVELVHPLPYDCAPASSTRIKQLRAAGRDREADHMEFYELQYD